ncbi:hypothetical protein CVE26_04970, partial [Pseudomonas syringae pv. actinidiae]|nr:hypothetical protein [Pseudomonas syringae pv. actinidiae]
TLRVVMPFRTHRVLLTTQSVETCIPTLERAERDINYRASLRVACRSGRSASSQFRADAESQLSLNQRSS